MHLENTCTPPEYTILLLLLDELGWKNRVYEGTRRVNIVYVDVQDQLLDESKPMTSHRPTGA